MELGTFGVENNYLEAILRSLRLSLLKEDNYAQMKNLSTLNDLKQVKFYRLLLIRLVSRRRDRFRDLFPTRNY
jgi:hypothetical protein